LVQLVGGLPHGMIHGEFFGKNVLVRRDRTTDAIAVIDWETAATRPQYVDLVSISAGRWTRNQRMAMRRAYFDARHASVAVGDDWRRFNQGADIVAILQAVSWLSFWVGSDSNDPKYASHVTRWIRELRTTTDETPGREGRAGPPAGARTHVRHCAVLTGTPKRATRFN
jgi:aminoglycoside phosphotransferase (APT) family kinase protein